MTKRRKHSGIPPRPRMAALLDLVARFRLLPAQVAVGMSTTGAQTTRNALNYMAREKYLKEYFYDAAYSPQLRKSKAYYLTRKAIREFENVRTCSAQFAVLPSDEIALWAFHRAHLTLALFLDGYSVGRSGRHLLGLRRFVVDSQRSAVAKLSGAAKVKAERVLEDLRTDDSLIPPTQLSCSKCGAISHPGKWPERPCGCARSYLSRVVVEGLTCCRVCGTENFGSESHPCCPSPSLRREETVPFDIALQVKKRSGFPLVAIVLVDRPNSSLEKVLEQLPLRFRGQPRIPVIVRPAEGLTIFDLAANRYRVKGPRFRRLVDAFSQNSNRRVSQFPYGTTTKLLTYRPHVGQRVY